MYCSNICIHSLNDPTIKKEGQLAVAEAVRDIIINRPGFTFVGFNLALYAHTVFGLPKGYKGYNNKELLAEYVRKVCSFV